jgi:hypothetical protein
MAVVESTNELKQLPLFALLAYAARCARRVYPLFRLNAGNPEARLCQQAIESAIRLTEELASGNSVDPAQLCVAEEGTVRAVVVASEMMPPDERAAYAANAAYAAISAAKALLEAYHSDNPEAEAERVADAAAIARDAANSADERVAHAAELDWDMLRRMFLGKYPDVGEPVEATETGILGALFNDAASSKRRESNADDETTVDVPKSRASRGKPRKDGESESAAQNQRPPSELVEKLKREAASIREQQEQLRSEAEQLAIGRTKLVADMEDLRNQVEGERYQLETERRSLNDELERLAGRQSEFEERQRQELEQVKSQRAEFERDRQSFRQQVEQFETRQIELAQLSEQSAEGAHALRAAQTQIHADRDNIDAERNRLAAERDALAAESQRLADALRQLEADRAAHESAAAGIHSAQTALQEREERHRREVESLASRQAEFEAQSGREADELSTRREELERQRGEHRLELERFETARRDLDAESDRISDARNQLDADCNLLTAELARLHQSQQELERQRAANEEARGRLETESADFARERDAEQQEFEQEREQHRQLVERFKSDHAAIAAELAKIDEARRNLETEREQLTTDAERLHAAQKQLELDRVAHEEACARLTSDRHAVQKELDEGRSELEHERARHRLEVEKLEADRIAVATANEESSTARGQIDADRQAVIEETARLHESLERFDKDRREHEAARAQLEAELDLSQKKLDDRLVQLDEERNRHQQELEQFESQRREAATEKSRLDEAGAQLDSDRQTLMEETATLQEALQQFDSNRDELQADIEKLKTERQQFAQERAHARDEAEAIKAAAGKREAETALRLRDVESREARFIERENALEEQRRVHEQSLQESRLQIEGEKQQLRTAFESVQTERRDLLEEKLRWKPESAAGAEGEQAAPPQKSGHKRRKRHSKAQSPQPPQPAAENVELGEQLFRLQAERQQLQAMRTQFAEELQRMRAGRVDSTGTTAVPPAGALAVHQAHPKALRFLLDPGRASSGVIAEILSEVVMLGRLSGIHIARLEASDCRTCRLSRSRKSAAKASSEVVRTLVELQLKASTDIQEGHAESQSLLWDQFDSSLRMIIPVEAGLARMFPLGGPAAEDHKFRAIGHDAVDLASKDAAQRAAQNPISQPGTLPVDLITRQLQKIEGLLRRLSTEFNVTLELGPAGDSSTSLAGDGHRWRLLSRKRLWLGGLVTATAAGVAAGFHWWPTIARALGIDAE